MFCLATFYQSKPWRNLLKVLKSERLDAQGNLICAHCGKPIVKQYDCIGHHTILLTEENVNDADISLNPNRIQLVHHRCHNKIHNKLGHVQQKVYLVWGSPLSGKTSWAKSAMEPGDLLIDMDRIWQCISGQAPYVKPPRLNSIAFLLRDQLLDAVRVRRGKWHSAYIVGGYPLVSERERLLSSLGAESVHIDTDRETCIARLRCDENRNSKEWERYINDWWEKYSPPRS